MYILRRYFKIVVKIYTLNFLVMNYMLDFDFNDNGLTVCFVLVRILAGLYGCVWSCNKGIL